MEEMSDIIRITIDDREPREMSDILAMNTDVDLCTMRLKIGDYLVDDKILFERKRLDDFFESIKSGRLFKQSCMLAGSNYRSAIILEGGWRDASQSRISRQSVQGAIVTVSMMLGLPILRSQNMKETAQLIMYTARQALRRPLGTFYRQGYRPKGERRRRLFVLQGLPGIGPERAARLLDHFGNLESIFTADYDDLAQVKGIGYPTAKKIKNILMETRIGYGS